MARRRLHVWLVFLSLVLLVAASCTKRNEAPAVPERLGWVSDYAGILATAEKERLGAVLEAYEKETCHQVFLLLMETLAGEDIGEFSQRTATAWGIGQPGLGNGILVTVALEESTVRIEAASAFEWMIQDGTADRILKEGMFPYFRENRFVEGLEHGLEEIMKAGRLKPIPENQKPDVCRP